MPSVSPPSVLDDHVSEEPHNTPGQPLPTGTPPRAARPAASRRAVPVLVGLTALLLVGTAGWSWLSRSDGGTRQSSPLEPTAATDRVLVPAADVAPASGLAAAAVATADGATKAVGAVADTLTSLRASLDQLTGRVDALESADRAQNTRLDAVEQSSRSQGEQVAALRSDMDRFAQERNAVQANAKVSNSVGKSAPKPRHATTARKPAPAKASTPSADVLAVDLWAGKPSVVVAHTGESGGKELRFVNEGEAAGRVTLKRADIGSQEATFATPAGDKTLAAKER